MGEYVLLLVLVVLGTCFAIGVAVGKGLADESVRRGVLRKEWELKGREQQHEERIARREQALREYHLQREQDFLALVEEAKRFALELQNGILRGRQWLANAFAEYVDLRTSEVERWLQTKSHPAPKAAEQVKAVRQKYRNTIRRLKLLEYQLASYEEYFPFLVEYREAILDESVELRDAALQSLVEADPALSRGYLSRQEYDRLSKIQKFQLALDRYWERPKSQWEIGRIYERYMGYLYEQEGWHVTYEGILKGYEDFGRDLICVKGQEVHVVQCKCWSQDKVIREKHVFQLFGTSVMYELREHRQATPVLATTTKLSPEALRVAEALHVKVRYEPLRRYPMIKCNINQQTGERIYHLPFDQQYDNVIVGNIQGEFYAETVAEAEKAGFRRAFRWRGDSEGQT